MEILLLLSLLLNAVVQSTAQSESADPPDVEVRRFSWSEFRRPVLGDPIRMDESIDKSQRQVYAEETFNRNSVENRSRDLRILEQRASAEAQGKGVLEYRYSAEIKNNGTKIIRTLFWEYQSGDPNEPDKMQRREFGCLVKIKPNESKGLEAFAYLPASRVVTASGKRPPERVLINRIEYVDGTLWVRAGWTLNEEVIKAATRGGCKALVAG